MDEKKVTVVSFSTLNFIKSQKRLSASAYKYSYKTLEYTWLWLLFKPKFFVENFRLLLCRRGAGYWIWKPFIILRQLKKQGNNDFLVYCDSGIEIINDLTPIINLCEKNNGIFLAHTIGDA